MEGGPVNPRPLPAKRPRKPTGRSHLYESGTPDDSGTDSEDEKKELREKARLADAYHDSRDPSYHSDDGAEPAGGWGGAAAGPPARVRRGRVTLRVGNPVLRSVLIAAPSSELPSADLAMATAKLLKKHLGEYYRNVFATLNELVVDLDEIEDEQLDVLQEVMMHYTAEGTDPMQHLDINTEKLEALLSEVGWNENAEELFEKQEAVLRIVKTAKPHTRTFLGKFAKLRMQAMALYEQGVTGENIERTFAYISDIDRDLQGMYAEYPHVRGRLFSRPYLAEVYRAPRAGGFALAYAAFVKIETGFLRKTTDTAAGNERGVARGKSTRISSRLLRQRNETEGAQPGPGEPEDDGAVPGEAETDRTYGLSDGDEVLRTVWNAAVHAEHHFSYHDTASTMAWAQGHQAYIDAYMEAAGLDPAKEADRPDLDALSAMKKEFYSDLRAQRRLDEQGPPVDAAEEATADLELAALVKERMAERVARRKATRDRNKATQKERREEGDIARRKEKEEREERGARGQAGAGGPAYPKKHAGVVHGRLGIPLSAPGGGGGAFARAYATPAPRPAPSAPAPAEAPPRQPPVRARGTLPPVLIPRVANYVPVRAQLLDGRFADPVIDTRFVWPSRDRVENPNLVLAADYYDPWIAELTERMADQQTQLAHATAEGASDKRLTLLAESIGRTQNSLDEAEYFKDLNAVKLSGEIRYDPSRAAEAAGLRGRDEAHTATNAPMIAQMAAAAEAQEVAQTLTAMVVEWSASEWPPVARSVTPLVHAAGKRPSSAGLSRS